MRIDDCAEHLNATRDRIRAIRERLRAVQRATNAAKFASRMEMTVEEKPFAGEAQHRLVDRAIRAFNLNPKVCVPSSSGPFCDVCHICPCRLSRVTVTYMAPIVLVKRRSWHPSFPSVFCSLDPSDVSLISSFILAAVASE